ncbi:CDP-glycerol glycerophosphotransferase family protein [Glycomyces tritici]|uniref:CDP-glycerol glycerophosphotransferase family protein n=1 Tax=Glycomyces tritici TaxID=2665176 RepID=A0ABT7YP94_9ACTN|nr:CDP-glycerol glycerophosphotransferase family protein [Glycomyces tritici]MDN3240420.1 CDP-glycerol glycerophosphotransferase family protein [Glycomyces tritici]
MNLLRKLLSRTATTGLAALALAAALLPWDWTPWAAWALAAGTLVLAWREHPELGPDRDRFARGVALAAIGAVAAQHGALPAAIAAGALIAVVGFEPLLAVAVATGHMTSANLEVQRDRTWFTPRAVGETISASGFIFALGAGGSLATGTGGPLWIAAVAALATVGAAGAGAAGALLQRRRSAHAGDQAVISALEALEPQFIVHFSGPPGSAYQLEMWLPYLDRLGDPYAVVTREKTHLDAVRAATGAPVVVAPSMSELERLLVPSVKAAFYVNGSALNTHLVRFGHLKHLQLFHGESDKASSFNKVTAIYDTVFVAGQAAVDRYRAHGLDLDFRKVGRPQLAAVATGPRTASGPRPVLLYAPTWTGLTSEFDYSSLAIGKRIVEEALRRDLAVIMRAHPYTRFNLAAARRLDEIERLLAEDAERSGRAHLWGSQAAGSVGLVDCINAADIAVCDVSGVATDWIASDRPFAVTDMAGLGERFTEEAWIAKGAYRLDRDAANVAAVFDELLVTDSKAAQRKETREYFLGETAGDAAVEVFTTAAKEAYRA